MMSFCHVHSSQLATPLSDLTASYTPVWPYNWLHPCLTLQLATLPFDLNAASVLCYVVLLLLVLKINVYKIFLETLYCLILALILIICWYLFNTCTHSDNLLISVYYLHSFWSFVDICLLLALILIIWWYLFNTCTHSDHLLISV